MESKEKFTRNMAFRMERLRITDSMLARAIGRTPATVGRWKKGLQEPSFMDIDKIAKALDCSASALFAESMFADDDIDPKEALRILAAALGEKDPTKGK